MSKEVKISISGQPYSLRFGYGAIRLIGKELNTKGYNQTVQTVGAAVSKLSPEENKSDQEFDIPFEVMDTLLLILKSGIQNADPDQELIPDDQLADGIFEDPAILSVVIQAFMDSMPRAKESPEPKSKSGGKRSPRK